MGRLRASSCKDPTASLWHLPKRQQQQHQHHATDDAPASASTSNSSHMHGFEVAASSTTPSERDATPAQDAISSLSRPYTSRQRGPVPEFLPPPQAQAPPSEIQAPVAAPRPGPPHVIPYMHTSEVAHVPDDAGTAAPSTTPSVREGAPARDARSSSAKPDVEHSPVPKYDPSPQAQVQSPPSSSQSPAAPPRHDPPAAAAPALFAELPFWQPPLPVAACCPDLSYSRVQEVQEHLQRCVPQLPQLDPRRERLLSSEGIVQFSGVNPDWVVVRQGVVGQGGCGSIQL